MYSVSFLKYLKQMPVEFMEEDTEILLNLGTAKINTLAIKKLGHFIMHFFTPTIGVNNQYSIIYSSIHQIFIECLLIFRHYFWFWGIR